MGANQCGVPGKGFDPLEKDPIVPNSFTPRKALQCSERITPITKEYKVYIFDKISRNIKIIKAIVSCFIKKSKHMNLNSHKAFSIPYRGPRTHEPKINKTSNIVQILLRPRLL